MSEPDDEQTSRKVARRVLHAQRRREAPAAQAAEKSPPRRNPAWLFALARVCMACAIALCALALGLIVLQAQS
jgi:hypothetical protein